MFYKNNCFNISFLSSNLYIASLEFIMTKKNQQKGEFHKEIHRQNGRNTLESLSVIGVSFGIPEKSHLSRATKPRR